MALTKLDRVLFRALLPLAARCGGSAASALLVDFLGPVGESIPEAVRAAFRSTIAPEASRDLGFLALRALTTALGPSGAASYAAVRRADARSRWEGRVEDIPLRAGTVLLAHPTRAEPGLAGAVMLLLEVTPSGDAVGIDLAGPPVGTVGSLAFARVPVERPALAAPRAGGRARVQREAAAPNGSWPPRVSVGGKAAARQQLPPMELHPLRPDLDAAAAGVALGEIHGMLHALQARGLRNSVRRKLTAHLKAATQRAPRESRLALGFPFVAGDELSLSYDPPPEFALADAAARRQLAELGVIFLGADGAPSPSEDVDEASVCSFMASAGLMEWYGGARAIAGLGEAEAFYRRARINGIKLIMHRERREDDAEHTGEKDGGRFRVRMRSARLRRRAVRVLASAHEQRTPQKGTQPSGAPPITARLGGHFVDGNRLLAALHVAVRQLRSSSGRIAGGSLRDEGAALPGSEDEDEESDGEGASVEVDEEEDGLQLAGGMQHAQDEVEDWGGRARVVSAILLAHGPQDHVQTYRPLPLGPGLDMPSPPAIAAAQDAWDAATWARTWRVPMPDVALIQHSDGAASSGAARGGDSDSDSSSEAEADVESSSDSDGASASDDESEDEDGGEDDAARPFHTVDAAALQPGGSGLWAQGAPVAAFQLPRPVAQYGMSGQQDPADTWVAVAWSPIRARPRPGVIAAPPGPLRLAAPLAAAAFGRSARGTKRLPLCRKLTGSARLSTSPLQRSLLWDSRPYALRARAKGGAPRDGPRNEAVTSRPVALHLTRGPTQGSERWATYIAPLCLADGKPGRGGYNGALLLTVPFPAGPAAADAPQTSRAIDVHLLGSARALRPSAGRALLRSVVSSWAADVRRNVDEEDGTRDGGEPDGRHVPVRGGSLPPSALPFSLAPVWRGGAASLPLLLHSSPSPRAVPVRTDGPHPPLYASRPSSCATIAAGGESSDGSVLAFFAGATTWAGGALAGQLGRGAWVRAGGGGPDPAAKAGSPGLWEEQLRTTTAPSVR